jgi:hypothetical protein
VPQPRPAGRSTATVTLARARCPCSTGPLHHRPPRACSTARLDRQRGGVSRGRRTLTRGRARASTQVDDDLDAGPSRLAARGAPRGHLLVGATLASRDLPCRRGQSRAGADGDVHRREGRRVISGARGVTNWMPSYPAGGQGQRGRDPVRHGTARHACECPRAVPRALRRIQPACSVPGPVRCCFGWFWSPLLPASPLEIARARAPLISWRGGRRRFWSEAFLYVILDRCRVYFEERKKERKYGF